VFYCARAYVFINDQLNFNEYGRLFFPHKGFEDFGNSRRGGEFEKFHKYSMSCDFNIL
jgi:hypothetical protein